MGIDYPINLKKIKKESNHKKRIILFYIPSKPKLF